SYRLVAGRDRRPRRSRLELRAAFVPVGGGLERVTRGNSAVGTIAEVIYVGTATRIIVDLDAGPRITVLEQNSASENSETAKDRRGERVHAEWPTAAIVPLEVAASQ
ncbi:MAG: spermidine/putrescine transporter ATP-binding protein, partial [Glaciihabitans sp.]|nr:spermidine/putrescine transporter ATP-binding protein [Glaciihabitans sp.]